MLNEYVKQSEQHDLSSQFSPLIKRISFTSLFVSLSLSRIHPRIKMDLRKAPSRGGFGGGNASSFFSRTTIMINNKEKTNNDSFLEEAEDDLKGVRRFLRLSDKDEEDEEDDREKEKATRTEEENEQERDVRRFR